MVTCILCYTRNDSLSFPEYLWYFFSDWIFTDQVLSSSSSRSLSPVSFWQLIRKCYHVISIRYLVLFLLQNCLWRGIPLSVLGVLCFGEFVISTGWQFPSSPFHMFSEGHAPHNNNNLLAYTAFWSQTIHVLVKR